MGRFKLQKILLALLLPLAWFTGCSSATAGDAMTGAGFTADKPTGWSVELRYLQDSHGSNYLHTTVADEQAVQALYAAIQTGKPAKEPKTEHFSPEYNSDCELYFSNGKTNFSLYYVKQGNLLVFPSRVKGSNGKADTLRYLYFTPDDTLNALLDGHKRKATLVQSETAEPFRNMEELKSSIDPDELAEEGVELDFEFFDGELPANSGTACKIYTAADDGAIPADSYLVTAYSKDAEGKQVKLSIEGFDANANYTMFYVSPPDEALESVDAGDEPNASAVTVKKDAIDPGKWIVFLDDSGQIYDVILPEDFISNQ